MYVTDNLPIIDSQPYSDELSFSNNFSGIERCQKEARKINAFCSEICKSELRLDGRRVANRVEIIFFKVKK